MIKAGSFLFLIQTEFMGVNHTRKLLIFVWNYCRRSPKINENVIEFQGFVASYKIWM